MSNTHAMPHKREEVQEPEVLRVEQEMCFNPRCNSR